MWCHNVQLQLPKFVLGKSPVLRAIRVMPTAATWSRAQTQNFRRQGLVVQGKRYEVGRERRHYRLQLWQTFLVQFDKCVTQTTKEWMYTGIKIARAQKSAGLALRLMPHTLVKTLDVALGKPSTSQPVVAVPNLSQIVALDSAVPLADGTVEECQHAQTEEYSNPNGKFRSCKNPACKKRWKSVARRDGSRGWTDWGRKGDRKSDRDKLEAEESATRRAGTSAPPAPSQPSQRLHGLAFHHKDRWRYARCAGRIWWSGRT